MNDTELLRYNRQIMLPDIDIAGQERLLASKVLIIGLGGLGSPIAHDVACRALHDGAPHLALPGSPRAPQGQPLSSPLARWNACAAERGAGGGGAQRGWDGMDREGACMCFAVENGNQQPLASGGVS